MYELKCLARPSHSNNVSMADFRRAGTKEIDLQKLRSWHWDVPAGDVNN